VARLVLVSRKQTSHQWVHTQNRRQLRRRLTDRGADRLAVSAG
jgi:hypothetical protein